MKRGTLTRKSMKLPGGKKKMEKRRGDQPPWIEREEAFA